MRHPTRHIRWPRPAGPAGWLLAVLPTLLVLVACAGDDGGSGWTVASEALPGGGTRVINTPPSAGARPTLVAEEELRIGTVDGGGPSSFGVVRQLGVVPDGRIAVADGQAEEVRIFASDGSHLRTFGGQGAGPGELRGSQGVMLDHEGLLRVAEQANARLTVFHPDSGYVTSYPLRLSSYSFRGPWRAVMDSAGRTLVASSGQYGVGRFWNMLRIYDPAMKQLDSIPYHEYTNEGRTDTPGAWRIDLGPGAFSWRSVPFYAQEHSVLDPSGEFWTSREGATELEVARWVPAGDTALVLVSRRAPGAVGAAERDSAIAGVQASLERVPNPPRLDYSRIPATKPPLHGLSLDEDGRLWVRLTDPAADTTTYDVFDRDGRHVETVALPFRVDRFVPPVVRGDRLWAVMTDALEVQHVVRARLRPAAARVEG